MPKVFAIRVTHPSDPGRVQWFSWTNGTEDNAVPLPVASWEIPGFRRMLEDKQ